MYRERGDVGRADDAADRQGLAELLTTRLDALALAVESAPIRGDLIAPGFVDTPLSARFLVEDHCPMDAHSAAVLLVVRPAA